MKYFVWLSFIGLLFTSTLIAQDTTWTGADKKILIDNFIRTQKEVNEETKNLTLAQWNFKENANAWSIAEVIEHLNMWQIVTQEHIRFMFYNGPQPALAIIAQTDSVATTFIYEEKKHISPDFTIPTGMVPGKANLDLFNVYCNRIIDNIKSSDLNFRLYFRKFTDGYMTNMNQAYIIQYGHVDRHLRQIRRIKTDKNFPKN